MLLTGAGDNFSKIWDVQYGKEKASLSTNTAVRCVGFSEGEREVLVVTDAKMGHPAKLMTFSLADFGKNTKPNQEIIISGSKITTAAWSIGSKFIYTGHEDGTLNVWDPKTGLQIRSAKEHSGSISDFQFSADKTFFITSSKDHTAKVSHACMYLDRELEK